MCHRLPPAWSRLGGRPYPRVPGTCVESGWEGEEDAFTTATAMLLRMGRWWGDRNNDNDKEEEVKGGGNSMTIAASGAAAGKKADSRSPQGGQ